MANEKKGNGEKDKKVQKRPTALKRDMQNIRKRNQNRAFKSNVRTTVNGFEAALAKGAEEGIAALKSIYSLMDKGVKKGIFKKNKAARVKARFTKKTAATAK